MTTEKKVTIVTGASKGIGAGIAKALAAESYAVVVNYASSKTDADRVVGEIERAGGKALAIHADVSKQAEVKKLFSETLKAFGHLNVLINNAGVYAPSPHTSYSREQKRWIKKSLRLIGRELKTLRRDIQSTSWWLMGIMKY